MGEPRVKRRELSVRQFRLPGLTLHSCSGSGAAGILSARWREILACHSQAAGRAVFHRPQWRYAQRLLLRRGGTHHARRHTGSTRGRRRWRVEMFNPGLASSGTIHFPQSTAVRRRVCACRCLVSSRGAPLSLHVSARLNTRLCPFGRRARALRRARFAGPSDRQPFASRADIAISSPPLPLRPPRSLAAPLHCDSRAGRNLADSLPARRQLCDAHRVLPACPSLLTRRAASPPDRPLAALSLPAARVRHYLQLPGSSLARSRAPGSNRVCSRQHAGRRNRLHGRPCRP